MSTIIVTHEDNEVDEFEFESGQSSISIGRRSSNDVCVPNLSVSGNHASIVFEESGVWLEDLKSTNGTYVNGKQITRREIRDGDEIIIGKVRLAFVNPEQVPVSTHSPAQAETESTLASQDLSSGFAQESRAPSWKEKPASLSANGAEVEAEVEVETKLLRPDDSKTLDAEEQISAAKSAAQTTAKSAESEDDEASFARDASLFNQAPKASNGVAASTPPESPHPIEGVEHQEASTVAPMHELDSTPASSKGAVIEIKNGAKSGQILPIDKPVTTLGRPGIQIAAIMRKPDGYFLMHIESDDSVDRPTLNQDAIGDEPVLLHSGDELNVAGIDVEFMLS